MRFIIGGAYQGKTRYAMEKYGLTPADVADGRTAEDISGFKCINNFHQLIRRMPDIAQKLIADDPDVIIIMDEIGNGIVPLERSERIWREQVGRAGCLIAEKSETVERVICGVPVRIKP